MLRPTCGGLQGDKPMPLQFLEAYKPLLNEWRESVKRFQSVLQCCDAQQQEWTDVDMASVADDVSNTDIATSELQVVTSAMWLGLSLSKSLALAQMKQHEAKKILFYASLAKEQGRKPTGSRGFLSEMMRITSL